MYEEVIIRTSLTGKDLEIYEYVREGIRNIRVCQGRN